ncbi:MAG: glucosaminidase domain-containing protein [Rikenellaceae bacterium]
MKRVLLLTALIFASLQLSAQKKMTVSEYIAVYSDLAIANMTEYGIPASITMAQGILESSSGNSILAQKSNNHFGIKCKTDWTGATVLHDDDEKGECFRKYETVYDSYIDHSKFLRERDRYNPLFKLDATDYKSWAEGLKSAGYATNPQYAQNLIRIIEENELYKLDDAALNKNTIVETPKQPSKEIVIPVVVERVTEGAYCGPTVLASDYTLVTSTPIPTYLNNNVKFIITRQGDTFASIAKQTGKSISKLMKYNELTTAPTQIDANSIIYISGKKSKAANGYNYHTVSKGETLYFISQKYGIKIDKLAALNLYTRHYAVKQGQKMLLR